MMYDIISGCVDEKNFDPRKPNQNTKHLHEELPGTVYVLIEINAQHHDVLLRLSVFSEN